MCFLRTYYSNFTFHLLLDPDCKHCKNHDFFKAENCNKLILDINLNSLLLYEKVLFELLSLHYYLDLKP